jgi:hypothetical protein
VKVSRTSLPEEGEFEMDLEVGQQASSRLPAQGEFEMDLELETSPHTLVSRKVPVFSSFRRGNINFSEGIRDPGSGRVKIRIRDKHPGSATVQHCLQDCNMIRVVHPGSGSRVLIFYSSRIPDSGV